MTIVRSLYVTAFVLASLYELSLGSIPLFAIVSSAFSLLEPNRGATQHGWVLSALQR